MEKFSQWRDPATGINPFVPARQASVSPVISLALWPLGLLAAIIRGTLLVAVAAIHVALVDGLCSVLKPVPALHRPLSSAATALTCRLALGVLGYYWINAETASPKRGGQTLAQAVRGVQLGDLIVVNWTGYVDVLYLASKHNPTFLLPVFSPAPPSEKALTGRHTGTGSAAISSAATTVQPPFMGYKAYTLLQMLVRTGSLPETYSTPPAGMFKTLREARRGRVVCLMPEATTSNGRAVLKIPQGVLGDGDVGGSDEGMVWVKHLKNASPCPLDKPLLHLYTLLSSLSPQSLSVRTLHPLNSPSSPSFLPSEILSATPGGMEGVKDGQGAWREAVATVLAETGRVRRVKGMGWVEKAGFLEYIARVRR